MESLEKLFFSVSMSMIRRIQRTPYSVDPTDTLDGAPNGPIKPNEPIGTNGILDLTDPSEQTDILVQQIHRIQLNRPTRTNRSIVSNAMLLWII